MFLNIIIAQFSSEIIWYFDKLPKFTCAAREDVLKHNQLMKLMQFLMGLNNVHQPTKSSLLSRETLPNIKDAFATVSREESHRGIPSFYVSGSKFRCQVSCQKPIFLKILITKGSTIKCSIIMVIPVVTIKDQI